MKFVVFGASGGVGTHIVRLARQRGYTVTAVACEESIVPNADRAVRVDALGLARPATP
jgi:uncharacterized protein YbjT (DUF2867 family)